MSGFIIILIGINLLPVMADSVNQAQTSVHTATVNNESIAIWGPGEGATTQLTVHDLIRLGTSVTCVNNFSGVATKIDGAGLGCIQAGNYTTTTMGHIINTTKSEFASKAINVTYNYNNEIANANVSGAVSTVTGLVVLFYALGIMAAGIVVAIEGLKDAGVLSS